MELAIVVAGIFILYLLQVVVYRLFWDEGLTVRLSFEQKPVQEGETVCLYETLTNQKRLALPAVYVMFDLSRNGRSCQKEESDSDLEIQRKNIPRHQKKVWFLSEILSLHGKEEKKRTIEIKGLKRGLYRIPEVRLTVSNLFLTDRFSVSAVSGSQSEKESETEPEKTEPDRQILLCDSSLYVYPKSLPEQELKPLFQLLSDYERTKRFSYEDVFEIRGIREYQSFDPMKRINWKASARTGRLQVNQMEYIASQQVILVVVFGETEEKIKEYAISLAAGLADVCLEQRIPVGVLSNGEDFLTEAPLWIGACKGRDGRETLQQGLSRLCFPRKLADIGQLLKEELEQEEQPVTYVILDASRGSKEEKENGTRKSGISGQETLVEQLSDLCQEYGKDSLRWEVTCGNL